MSISDYVNLPNAAGSALGATIFGWLGAYVAAKGKIFATKQDVQFLRDDLQANTEITKAADQKFGRSDVIWRGELAFRQQQLAELYGPMYGYIKSQSEIYVLWMDQKMDARNADVKKLFSTQNEKIRDLIVAKTHLIEGDKMPNSFVRFVTSTLVFDLYATHGDGDVPKELRTDPRTAYPRDFNEHVIQVTEALKARIDTLNRQYAPPLMKSVPP